MPNYVERIYLKYGRYFPALFFIFGFLFDVFTLSRIDDIFNIIMQIGYLAIIVYFIYLDFLQLDEDEIQNRLLRKIFKLKDEIFHFILGSLLSAFTLFYFKSASLSNAFVFMILMSGLLVLNEFPFFQKKGILVKSISFKLCLISFFLCLTPFLFGQVGTLMFILSIIFSLLMSLGLGKIMVKAGAEMSRVSKEFYLPHIGVAVLFVLLYLFKVIPPVPLSIQEIGIYHNIEKKQGEYWLYSEQPKWKFWLNGDEEFIARRGDKVHVFLRLFAPRGFQDRVYLRWQYLSKRDEWITSDRIPLNISGGRDKGYRGRAYKSNYQQGRWRILAETEDRLEIGRIDFDVLISSDEQPPEFRIQKR